MQISSGTLQPEAKLRQMAQQMSWVYKVDQQKAPLRIKQRVFQMGEYISGVSADFWLSYLVDILRKTFENEGVAVLEAEDLD